MNHQKGKTDYFSGIKFAYDVSNKLNKLERLSQNL